MTSEEYQELLLHAQKLEQSVESLRKNARTATYSRERTHANGAASTLELEAVWIRGFLKRHKVEK